MEYLVDEDSSEIDNLEFLINNDMKEVQEDNSVGLLLSNELKLNEISRRKFKMKINQEIIEGVPMAQMNNGSAFIFKTNKGMQKYNLSIINIVSEKSNIHCSFDDYLYDVALVLSKYHDFVDNNVEDASIHSVVQFLEDREDTINLKDAFEKDVPAEKSVRYILKIIS